MTARKALGTSLSVSGTRIPSRVSAATPYALITLYFALLLATYGLRGGDLEECSVGTTNPWHDIGRCPWFAGPLHSDPWGAATLAYRVWSGRFTVELIEYSLSHTLWLFALITVALGWLFIWSARTIFDIRTSLGLTTFAGLIFLLVPIDLQASAGVYATVITYSWTTFAGTFAAAVITRLIRRQRTSWFLVAATVPALAVALCLEQFVLLFTLCLAALAGYVVRDRRADLRPALSLYTALWIAGVVNILVSPGNVRRAAAETDYWAPQFAEEDLIEKLVDGLHHALYLLVSPSGSTSFLAAILALIMLGWARHDARASHLPGIGILLWLATVLTMTTAGIDLADSASMTVLTALALAIPATWGGIHVTRGHRSTRISIVALLLGGFASALLLAFSPTVWASGTRTLFVEYLTLAAAVFLLARCVWRHWQQQLLAN